MKTEFSSSKYNVGIQPLREQDLTAVSGGIFPAFAFNVALGTIGGATAGYVSDGWRGAAQGAIFGGAAVITGGLAAASTGFMRLAWGFRHVGLGAAAVGMATRRRPRAN